MGGHHSHHRHLKPEVIEDLKHISECSADEIKHWYANFLKDFPNGYISHDEMKSLYTKHYPKGDATKFADHAFRAFFKNENGQIDFKQFMCAISTTASGTLEEKLKWTFALYDVDGHGLITHEGMTEVLDALHKLCCTNKNMPEGKSTPRMMTEMVFTKLDTNNTGVLTFEQCLEGAKNNAEIRDIFRVCYRGRHATEKKDRNN